MKDAVKHGRPAASACVLAGVFALSFLGGEAQAQFKTKTGFTGVGFSEEISGVETDLAGLLQVLKDHTLLAGDTTKMSRMVFAYGITLEGEVLSSVVSEPVLFVPGDPNYVGLGSGPLGTPWDGFEDPLLGFEDPLLGFDNPIIAFEDPLLGFSVDSFEDPLLGLETIMDDLGIKLDYNLILFTMPDPDAQGGAEVQHSATVLPFTVR